MNELWSIFSDPSQKELEPTQFEMSQQLRRAWFFEGTRRDG
jgi:hypothetical protein